MGASGQIPEIFYQLSGCCSHCPEDSIGRESGGTHPSLLSPHVPARGQAPYECSGGEPLSLRSATSQEFFDFLLKLVGNGLVQFIMIRFQQSILQRSPLAQAVA